MGYKKFEIEEWRNDAGRLHRENGPAIIRRDSKTGTFTVEEYWINGELHREGGPAWIERDPETGTVTLEEYWVNGQGYVPEPRTPCEVIEDLIEQSISEGRSVYVSYDKKLVEALTGVCDKHPRSGNVEYFMGEKDGCRWSINVWLTENLTLIPE